MKKNFKNINPESLNINDSFNKSKKSQEFMLKTNPFNEEDSTYFIETENYIHDFRQENKKKTSISILN